MTSSFQKLRSKHPFWQNRTRWWSSILHKVPPQALTVGPSEVHRRRLRWKSVQVRKKLEAYLGNKQGPVMASNLQGYQGASTNKVAAKTRALSEAFCSANGRRHFRLWTSSASQVKNVGACAAWLLARTAASIEFPVFFEGPIARNASKHEPSSRKQCACLIACTIHVSSDFGLCKVIRRQSWKAFDARQWITHRYLHIWVDILVAYIHIHTRRFEHNVLTISVHIVIWSPHHPWHPWQCVEPVKEIERDENSIPSLLSFGRTNVSICVYFKTLLETLTLELCSSANYAHCIELTNPNSWEWNGETCFEARTERHTTSIESGRSRVANKNSLHLIPMLTHIDEDNVCSRNVRTQFFLERRRGSAGLSGEGQRLRGISNQWSLDFWWACHGEKIFECARVIVWVNIIWNRIVVRAIFI